MSRLRAVAITVFLAATVFPCAVDTSPRFRPGYYPEKPDERFIRGELGILSPALGKRYQLIAWRYLSGLSLTSEEQAALTQPIARPAVSAVESWRQARPGVMFIQTSKVSAVAPNTFYTNCLNDAFNTAAATLADRKQRYRDDALVNSWLQAQDQVFRNCQSSTPDYPADPDPSMPQLARADRMYQVAAAHFYAEDFEGAMQRFRTIAADTASPWQATAQYMIARVLLRQSVLMKRGDAAALARAQLAKVAVDPGAGRFQSAAGSLESFADSLLDPGHVFVSLNSQLTAAHPGKGIAEAIDTAGWTMRTRLFAKAYESPNLPEPFAWVRAIESQKPDEAIRRWKQSPTEVWLAAALMSVPADAADAPALLDAARSVPETSPAYDTVTYHSIRLIEESGRPDEARALLDRLLAGKPFSLAAVDNSFRSQRMTVATSFDDFLHWAPRRPIGHAEEYPDDNLDQSPVLDRDSIGILNHHVPIGMLADASASNRLPEWSQANVALMAFTRALVLHDDPTAARLAPAVETVHPAWSADLRAFTSAQREEKRFASALLIARHAQLETRLWPQFRKDDPNEGWWCGENSQPDDAGPSKQIVPEADAKEAAIQIQRLRDAGPAQSVIAPGIMAWAGSHPGDPRVPEALALVVRMTRYGCRGIPDINGPISKAAFDLLHQKYPNTDWAKNTPYWFKD